MINWDDLKFCLALERDGSMLNASKSLRANVATVSRRLERITEDFGETLFIRNGHDWQATSAGVELVAIARDVETRLADLKRSQDDGLADDAIIRLSVSLTIMQTFLKRITAYRDGNKMLHNIDLSIHDRSIAYSESDVSVRYTRPDHGNYICAKVTEVQILPYISVDAPEFPTNWIEIDYDGIRLKPADFGFEMPDIPKIRIEGLNLSAQAAIQENFLVFLPSEFAEKLPGLKPACDERRCRTLEVWMVYHKTRKLDPIVRAGVEIIQTGFSTESRDRMAS